MMKPSSEFQMITNIAILESDFRYIDNKDNLMKPRPAFSCTNTNIFAYQY